MFLKSPPPLGFHYVINTNTPLNVTWSQFETPIVQHTTIDSDGYGEGSCSYRLIFTGSLTITRLQHKNSAIFFSMRRVECGRITSSSHGRFWTHKVPSALPRVSYAEVYFFPFASCPDS